MTIAEAKRSIRKQGPCLMCDSAVPYAAHRLLDAELGALANGESSETVFEEYGHTAQEVAARAAAMLDLLYTEIAKLKRKLA